MQRKSGRPDLRWERVGVRGYGLSIVQRALTRFAAQIDLSPPGRGARNTSYGLDCVKKTHQVAGVGTGPGARPVSFEHRPATALTIREMLLTMAQGMKRLGTLIAALSGLALIGLIATSWLINREALRQAVEAQIRSVTGLDLVGKGNIDGWVFPGSYVSFHDVGRKGGDTADPALSVDGLTANLRL